MSNYWSIPRETAEWIGPVTHTPSDAQLELAILPKDQRPTEDDWLTPVLVDDKPGLAFDPPDDGAYAYWARITDEHGAAVVEAFATISVT